MMRVLRWGFAVAVYVVGLMGVAWTMANPDVAVVFGFILAAMFCACVVGMALEDLFRR